MSMILLLGVATTGACVGLVLSAIVNFYLHYYRKQSILKWRACMQPRHLLLVFTSMLVFVSGVWRFGASPQLVAILFAGVLLLTLVWVDIHEMILPDGLCYVLLWSGLLVNSQGLFVEVQYALWGAVIAYLSLWSCAQLFTLATGRDGMGYGDFKLCAALGAWLGVSALPQLILLASLSGIVFGLLRGAMSKNSWRQAIPFGPHLALAGWSLLLWGEDINMLRDHLLGIR